MRFQRTMSLMSVTLATRDSQPPFSEMSIHNIDAIVPARATTRIATLRNSVQRLAAVRFVVFKRSKAN